MKKKCYLLLTLVLLIFSFHSLHAQMADEYQFSATIGTYDTLVTGQSYNVELTSYDYGTTEVYLPFDFVFCGSNHPANNSTLKIFADGVLTFGTQAYANNSLNSLDHMDVIAPLWDDLQSVPGISGIRAGTIGTAPNRVYVIQYSNFRGFGGPTTSPFSFQVRLHETTNDIQFVYGPGFTAYQDGTQPMSASIGINNSFSTTNSVFFNSVTPTGNGTATNSITVANDAVGATQVNHLVLGTTYTFSPASVCNRATYATISNIDYTSAHLTWYPINSGNWEIKYGPLNFNPDTEGTSVIVTGRNYYTLSGLTRATPYDFYIRKVCGDNVYSIWSTKYQFTTKHDADVVPFTCSFDNVTQNQNWVLSNSSLSNWKIGSPLNDTENGTPYLFVTSDADNQGANISASNYSWAYYDVYFTEYSDYLLTFRWQNEGFGAINYMRVFIDNPSDQYGAIAHDQYPGTTLNLLSGPATNNCYSGSPSWTTDTIMLDPTYAGQTKRIYFLWRNQVGQTYGAAGLDDVSIIGLDCGRPRDLQVSNINVSTAIFEWTAASESDYQWEVVYGPAGFDPDQATAELIYIDRFSLQNLYPSTDYDFYVRTVCNEDMKSHWVGYSFMTSCGRITNEDLPYTPSLASTQLVDNMPKCWSRIPSANGDYPKVSGLGSPTIQQLQLLTTATDYCIAVLPEFDFSVDIRKIEIEFDIKRSTPGGSDYMFVGVMDDKTDYSTFTITDTVWTTDNAFVEQTVDLLNYTGSGRYIAFVSDSRVVERSNSIYITNITVSSLSDCISPNNLTFTAIRDEEIDLTWTPRGEETSWEIVCVPTGSLPSSGTPQTVTSSSGTFTGLQPDTDYNAYVRAICEDEESAWSSELSFKTACLPTDDLPIIESFENGSAGQLPDCWVGHSNYSPDYPMVTNAQSLDGARSIHLYCHSGAEYYTMLVSPELGGGIPIQQVIVSFQMYSNNFGINTKVGVISNPYDITTFEEIAVAVPSMINRWELQEISLADYEGEATHIAIMTVGSRGNNSPYIDDILIDYAYPCSQPVNLYAESIGTRSALLTWNTGTIGRTMDYTLEYCEMGTGGWISEMVYDNQFQIGNLEPRTHYEVRIVANCQGGSSEYTYTTFVTGCDSSEYAVVENGAIRQSSLPFSTRTRKSYSQEIYTPEEVGAAGNIFGLAFQYFAEYAQEKDSITIFLSHTTKNEFSNTTDWEHFDTLKQVFKGHLSLNNRGDNFWFEVPFDTVFAYNGTSNLMITILNNNRTAYNFGNYTMYTHNDTLNRALYYNTDVATSLTPESVTYTGTRTMERANMRFSKDCIPVACMRPDLVLLSVGVDHAIVSWNVAGSEIGWELQYKESSATTWITEDILPTEVDYFITPLTNNTSYDVRLRVLCSDTESGSWDEVSFTTPCDNIDVLPFIESFEGSTSLPNCWLGYSYNSTTDPVIASRGYSSSQSLSLSSSAFTEYSCAVLPALADGIEIRDLQIAFRLNKGADASAVQLGAMSDPNDISTFSIIHSFVASQTNTWERVEKFLNNYTGDAKYLAFRTAGLSTVLIDTIVIDYLPGCDAPTDITYTNIEPTEITISWTQNGDETEWQYLYAVAGSLNENITPNIHNGTPSITLNGLAPSTTYDFILRTTCNLGNSTNWVRMQFTTACATISAIPYNETFDTWGTGTVTFPMPDCWTKSSTYNTAHPYISDVNNSAPGALQITASGNSQTLAITPEFDQTVNVNSLAVEFSLRTTNSNFRLKVGVLSDPDDVSTFVALDSVNVFKNNSWDIAQVYLNNYTGIGKYIAFKNDEGGSFYIDDLSIKNLPTCFAPTDIEVVSIGAFNAVVNWRERGTETEWIIEYYEANNPSSVQSVTASHMPFTLNQLSSNTEYVFSVKASCGAGNRSERSCYGYFTTACDAYALPFEENFESYQGSAYNVAGVIPACWYVSSSDPVFPQPHVVTDGPYAYVNSGTKAISMAAGSNGNDAYLVFPELDDDYNNITLSFYAVAESPGAGTLKLGYLEVEQSNLQSFTEIVTIPVSGGYEEYVYALENYSIPTSAKYLAIHWHSTLSRSVVGIDDINATAPFTQDTCYAPTQAEAYDVTSNEAKIRWVAGGTESSWKMQYKKATDPTYVGSYTLTQPNYSFTDLLPLTNYNVLITALCEDGGESTTIQLDFTTLDVVIRQYTIHASAAANGTINPEGDIVLTEGSSQSFTITANTGFSIQSVVVDGEDKGDVSSFTFTNIDRDHTIHADFAAGIITISDEENILIYPNPAQNTITVETTEMFENMEIVNMFGQVVFETEINSKIITADVSHLAGGFYLIRLKSDHGVTTKKIIKQ